MCLVFTALLPCTPANRIQLGFWRSFELVLLLPLKLSCEASDVKTPTGSKGATTSWRCLWMNTNVCTRRNSSCQTHLHYLVILTLTFTNIPTPDVQTLNCLGSATIYLPIQQLVHSNRTNIYSSLKNIDHLFHSSRLTSQHLTCTRLINCIDVCSA